MVGKGQILFLDMKDAVMATGGNGFRMPFPITEGLLNASMVVLLNVTTAQHNYASYPTTVELPLPSDGDAFRVALNYPGAGNVYTEYQGDPTTYVEYNTTPDFPE